ncbi:hypothetical protein [Pseudoxanthomonas sp. J35]|uniref:hypothetical protein n=1 Tax=Pseudoxanthomonas sp. J35 TaxID=935852 RepID=UPI0004AD1B79|nr:hypothetical protein [Pseudoxanthomonas sp. J35]
MGSRKENPGKDPEQVQQENTQQRQQQELQQHRRNPSESEEDVRREQGGHDRPVRQDHKPGRRPEVPADDDGDGGASRAEDDRGPTSRGEASSTDPKAGVDREVGDLEDQDATDDDALPGRVGGGLAGG